jgi:transcriptional regulator GlxA family with amidase domain
LQKQKIITRPADEVFNTINTWNMKHSLGWLANQACLSPRQFERKAYQFLGITPQLFARIVRFNESYNMRLKSPQADWFSIAVRCGYHDYQHLVRDYKQFASTTPNNLFIAESKVVERALGLNK